MTPWAFTASKSLGWELFFPLFWFSAWGGAVRVWDMDFSRDTRHRRVAFRCLVGRHSLDHYQPVAVSAVSTYAGGEQF